MKRLLGTLLLFTLCRATGFCETLPQLKARLHGPHCQDWKKISWLTSAPKALHQSQATKKPILVVFSVGANGQAGAGNVWPGAQLCRAVALSDPRVIALIQAKFVPFQLNVTEQGFPPEFKGLERWQKAYESNQNYRTGFATSVVLEPAGQYPIASSGSGSLLQAVTGTSINYDPGRYAAFLELAVSRKITLEHMRSAGARERREDIKALLQDYLIHGF